MGQCGTDAGGAAAFFPAPWDANVITTAAGSLTLRTGCSASKQKHRGRRELHEETFILGTEQRGGGTRGDGIVRRGLCPGAGYFGDLLGDRVPPQDPARRRRRTAAHRGRQGRL